MNWTDKILNRYSTMRRLRALGSENPRTKEITDLKAQLRREWLVLSAALDSREPITCGMKLLGHFSPELAKQAKSIITVLTKLQTIDDTTPKTPEWLISLAGG